MSSKSIQINEVISQVETQITRVRQLVFTTISHYLFRFAQYNNRLACTGIQIYNYIYGEHINNNSLWLDFLLPV